MSEIKVTVPNLGETEGVARRVAAVVAPGTLVMLRGDLGMGKTVFARALIRALAGDPALEVPSPTFTLIQTYDTPRGVVHHFDLYRLKTPEDVYEIGWEDALAARGIVLVEWPERLGPLAPPEAVRIEFAGSDTPDGRIISIAGLTL